MTTTVALHTHVWNPDAPRSALLLHGLGSDGTTTWRLAHALAGRGLRVVAPDLRGHGASPSTPSYELEGYAADVRRLGSGWDVAVGHSLGGATAAHLATEPGWARSVVLIDPVLRLSTEDGESLRQALAGEVGGGLTVEGLRRQNPHWDDEDLFRKVRASATVSRRVTDASIDDNMPWDIEHLVPRWRAPVHVLAADPVRGAMFTEPEVKALRDVTGVAVTTVYGAGHSIHRDDPAAVLDAVIAALPA